MSKDNPVFYTGTIGDEDNGAEEKSPTKFRYETVELGGKKFDGAKGTDVLDSGDVSFVGDQPSEASVYVFATNTSGAVTTVNDAPI